MKTSLLFTLFIPTLLFGQITLTQSDFANANDTVRMSSTTDLTVDFTSTGPNYTWDFSNLVAADQNLIEFNSMTNASIYVYAVFGTFAPQEYRASYFVPSDAIPLDLISGFLPVNITDVFQYSRSSADSITSIGFAVSIEGNEVPFKSDTIETRYKFPMNFNDTYSSRGYSNMDMNPFYNGIWRQHRTRNSEVDGWGSITTPYGTFDALRIKHSITESDSIYMDILGTGTWINLPIPDSYIYEWWTNNQKEAILRISTSAILGNEVVTAIEYRDIYLGLNAGLKEELISLEVYPNPAVEELILKGLEKPGNYVVVDAGGKIALSGAITPGDRINVSTLETGVYKLFLHSDGTLGQTTFIKE